MCCVCVCFVCARVWGVGVQWWKDGVNNLMFRKGWHGDDAMVMYVNVNMGKQVTLLMQGISGFVSNAQLVYKDGCATIDHHGQIKNANSEKSLIEKLIPIPPPLHTAIVLDKASYHCTRLSNHHQVTYLFTYLFIYYFFFFFFHWHYSPL